MSSIPKNIFQTHKSMIYVNSKPKLSIAMSSWLKFSNEFNHYFYNNGMCDKFMKENFDETIYGAYSMLPMGVMKADLWRYCVIYKNGGIYADVDAVCNVDPNIFIGTAELIVSPEIGNPYFCQWTFAAPAGSPILKSIIDLSVHRILNTQIKGEHIIHYITGPELFTDGIEMYLKQNNLPTFDNKIDYFEYPSPILRVFNPYNFHNKFIKHLFAGDDNDGWKKERMVKLMK
jgi:mannosyltransferase OCH1-like enzyme